MPTHQIALWSLDKGAFRGTHGAVKELGLHLESLEAVGLRATAYMRSRVLRRDYREERQRLEQQTKARSLAEAVTVAAVLFGLAILAASYGLIGLGLFFIAAMVLFY